MKLLVQVDDDGHLTFVPVQARRTLASLTCLPAGLRVMGSRGSTALLAWERFERIDPELENHIGHYQWSVTGWARSKYGEARATGVGIRCDPSYGEEVRVLYAECRTLWRRARWMAEKTRMTLPVLPRQTVFVPHWGELATLRVLADVIHSHGHLRSRLDENERVSRLASDLRSEWLGDPIPRFGSGRDSTDIRTALRQGGYVHHYGRPLTPTGMPTVAEVVDRVEELLAANPFRTGRPTDRSQVEAIVRRDYVDVKTWPFAALVD